MKIEYAVLADAAQAVGGKVFILGGGWAVFRAANYPTPIQLAVAVGMAFTSNEIGIKYPLSLVIADEAGVPIVPEMKAQVETGQLPPDAPKGAPIKVPLAVNMNLSIPRPGRYGVVVTVGSSKAELSFDAIFVGQKVQLAPPEGSPLERGN